MKLYGVLWRKESNHIFVYECWRRRDQNNFWIDLLLNHLEESKEVNHYHLKEKYLKLKLLHACQDSLNLKLPDFGQCGRKPVLIFHEVFPCYAWYIFGNIIEYTLIWFNFGSFSFRNEQVMHNYVKLVCSDFRFMVQRKICSSHIWFHRDLKIGGRIVHYVLNNFHSF